MTRKEKKGVIKEEKNEIKEEKRVIHAYNQRQEESGGGKKGEEKGCHLRLGMCTDWIDGTCTVYDEKSDLCQQ